MNLNNTSICYAFVTNFVFLTCLFTLRNKGSKKVLKLSSQENPQNLTPKWFQKCRKWPQNVMQNHKIKELFRGSRGRVPLRGQKRFYLELLFLRVFIPI